MIQYFKPFTLHWQKFPAHSRYLLFVVGLSFFFIQCDNLQTVTDRPVARVENAFLYASELREAIGSYSSPQDSTIKAQAYISNWARKKLLYELSTINTSPEKRAQLDALIDQYRVDLYAQTYKENLITRRLDTLVPETQLWEFYTQNQAVFTLKEPLCQYRLIKVPLENVELNQLRRSLRRFDSIDRVNLDSLSFQFADFQLNDSLWQPQDKLREQLNFDEAKRLTRYLKKSQFFEIRDSLEVYLLFVKDLLDQGDTAPYSYVSNTLKNIILNQRKLAFLRQFDNEIIQDAIQTKKVEFYQ